MMADPSEQTVNFYKAAGFQQDDLTVFRDRFQIRSQFMTSMPTAYRQIKEGEQLTIGEHEWTVLVGKGHSPEHACLYCKDLNLLIAGDQILPRITPNVSVRPDQPTANPLDEWLDSCNRFKSLIDETVLILPSHGDPFYGAPLRIQEIIDDHELSLARLYESCSQPQRVVDVFPALFKGKVEDHNLVIGTCEALAHLNYLLERQQLEMFVENNGVKRFQQG